MNLTINNSGIGVEFVSIQNFVKPLLYAIEIVNKKGTRYKQIPFPLTKMYFYYIIV
ncbi:hypothetical protein [Labilibaculum manganireducens]|uniref:hypothetical protein n=1 Tax=Labilibaculum manganireducens TaxID=1940525 RepID=UPI0029F4E0C3|nr:hypothetical protein [Labilibaculum manganireducens]